MTEAICRDLYFELLKRVLVGMIYQESPTNGLRFGEEYHLSNERLEIPEWEQNIPSQVHSMIGLRRMDNIQMCVEQVLNDHVPGDLIETGVWRGGATLFMRALLAAYQVTDRCVWVADSFEGMPVPDLQHYPIDGLLSNYAARLAVSVESVQQTFARYGLLDDQVKFLKGWFKDSLPNAPITQLAVLRLDGDLYSSTWDVLSALYDKVAPGGFVIVDDYNVLSCRQAIKLYRAKNQIREPIQIIDECGVYWRRDF
jgi:hypothetical protein